ncbi:MAG: PorT family protein [Spirochaetes bacterium]|nr:PorT family protein [Spirochaetota bacterium]
MKKALIFFICFLFASSLYATEVKFGGAIGLNGSWNSGSDWKDYLDGNDNIIGLGFEAGVFANIAVSSIFSFQPEFNFLYLRAGQNNNDLRIIYTTKALEIPVLARFSFWDLNFFLGPAVHIILGNMAYELTEDNPVDPITHTISIDNRVVLAVIVGVSYALPFGSGEIVFDFRYRRTLTDMFDAYGDSFLRNLRHNSVGIRVGYSFGF